MTSEPLYPAHLDDAITAPVLVPVERFHHAQEAEIESTCLIRRIDAIGNIANENIHRPGNDDEISLNDSYHTNSISREQSTYSDEFGTSPKAPRTRSRLVSQLADFSLTPLTMPSSANASLYSASAPGLASYANDRGHGYTGIIPGYPLLHIDRSTNLSSDSSLNLSTFSTLSNKKRVNKPMIPSKRAPLNAINFLIQAEKIPENRSSSPRKPIQREKPSSATATRPLTSKPKDLTKSKLLDASVLSPVDEAKFLVTYPSRKGFRGNKLSRSVEIIPSSSSPTKADRQFRSQDSNNLSADKSYYSTSNQVDIMIPSPRPIEPETRTVNEAYLTDKLPPIDRGSTMTDNDSLQGELQSKLMRQESEDPSSSSPKQGYDRDHRPPGLESMPPSYAATEALAHKINAAIDAEEHDYSSTRDPLIQRASLYNDHGYPGADQSNYDRYVVDDDGYRRLSRQTIKKPEMTLLQLINDLKRQFDSPSKSASRAVTKDTIKTKLTDKSEVLSSSMGSEASRQGKLLSSVMGRVQDEKEDWVGYRYRNRMLGWKLTSYSHRKDLVQLLDLIHSKADGHTRSRMIHTRARPRTQQLVAEIARESYGDESILDFAADVFVDKLPKRRPGTGYTAMNPREITAWETAVVYVLYRCFSCNTVMMLMLIVDEIARLMTVDIMSSAW
jgi:hypothetical protein